jgi:hypothetical protein
VYYSVARRVRLRAVRAMIRSVARPRVQHKMNRLQNMVGIFKHCDSLQPTTAAVNLVLTAIWCFVSRLVARIKWA